MFIDCRFDKGHGEETFRELFQANIAGSDKSDHNGQDIHSTQVEALAKAGLLIPANVPGLWTSLDEARKLGLKLGVCLCEGVKSMKAMDKRISTPDARKRAAKAGLYLVASAWLSGPYGARNTNFGIRPWVPIYVITGTNDIPFPVTEVIWLIAIDGDEQGGLEGRDVALRLVGQFDVGARNVRIVDPPIGYETVSPHWDEADLLPNGTDEEKRLEQIVESTEWPDHNLYQHEIILRDDRYDANVMNRPEFAGGSEP